MLSLAPLEWLDLEDTAPITVQGSGLEAEAKVGMMKTPMGSTIPPLTQTAAGPAPILDIGSANTRPSKIINARIALIQSRSLEVSLTAEAFRDTYASYR